MKVDYGITLWSIFMLCYAYITKQIGEITMPKPVTKNGVTIFELSPEEKKVVELEKRVRQLEESNQKILERLDSIK